MKTLVSTVIFTALFAQSAAAASMKIEGTCSGTLPDQRPIKFSYYSDFNGCKDKGHAAVSIKGEVEELMTGSRSFEADKDIYRFGDSVRIILADSTGNTEAAFSYADQEGKRHNLSVQCSVRDYEYIDC